MQVPLDFIHLQSIFASQTTLVSWLNDEITPTSMLGAFRSPLICGVVPGFIFDVLKMSISSIHLH